MTVAGDTTPSAPNTCVIPTFFPRMPVNIADSCRCSLFAFRFPLFAVRFPLFAFRCSACLNRTAISEKRTAIRGQRLFVFFTERLDLDVHTSGQIEFHERVDRLRR